MAPAHKPPHFQAPILRQTVSGWRSMAAEQLQNLYDL
jgi:hypothetical protein